MLPAAAPPLATIVVFCRQRFRVEDQTKTRRGTSHVDNNTRSSTFWRYTVYCLQFACQLRLKICNASPAHKLDQRWRYQKYENWKAFGLIGSFHILVCNTFSRSSLQTLNDGAVRFLLAFLTNFPLYQSVCARLLISIRSSSH
jgi:hypothetical protein